MSKLLILANIVAAFFLALGFFSKQPTAGVGRSVVAAPPPPSTRLTSGALAEDTVDSVRQRIERKLRAEYLGKFLASFETGDATMRSNLDAIKEGIYHYYASVFRELGLSVPQTERLAELLSRRETSTKYFIGAPAEVVKAGVPASLTFGAAEIEAQVESEFGAAVLARIKSFDAELPVIREQRDLLAILASSGGPPDSVVASKIKEALRANPLPTKPQHLEDEAAMAAYHGDRVARIDRIIEGVAATMGKEQGALLREYMMQKEESSLNLAALERARVSQSKK